MLEESDERGNSLSESERYPLWPSRRTKLVRISLLAEHSLAQDRTDRFCPPGMGAVEYLPAELKRRVKAEMPQPSAETVSMLFWTLLASKVRKMRKVDHGETPAEAFVDYTIDLAD